MILSTTKRTTRLLSFLFGLLPALFCMANVANAQYDTVQVTGFNGDFVADGTGSPASASTTVTFGNYVVVSPTFGTGATACGTAANTLPASNLITSTNTTNNTGLTYRLQPYGNGAATNNNVLAVNGGASGTFSLVTPVSAAALYLVGMGNGNFTVTINYTDATTETVAGLSMPDWCTGAATYKLTSSVFYRILNTSTSCNGSNCPFLFEVPVAISPSNYSKLIGSIKINNTTASTPMFIFAVGKKATCAAPAAPAGLTFTATHSSISGSFTASTATGYVVVRYPAGSTPTAPVAGTTYTSGMSLGVGTVVGVGNTTNFTATGLYANTTYDFYVYGYNTGGNCGGPIYSATPLTGSQTTATCGAPTLGTVNAGVRTITVGPTSDAATITAVLANLDANGLNSPTIIELQSGYVSTTETFPITFPASGCIGSVNTLTLRPAAGANGLVIAGSNAGPTIDLNGADYITIDGRPGGTGSSISFTAAGSLNPTNLNITNTAAAGAAIKIGNGANNNIIQYCDLQGQNTVVAGNSATIGGVVYIDNTGSTGNDNNTISYCNIHSTSASAFPAMGIYALGTNVTTGYDVTSNDSNTVNNSNIYDYFSATSGNHTTGIELNYGNNAWQITNNSFFQTASRSVTAAVARAIWVYTYHSAGNVGNGFNISNNYIGGSEPQCGGTAYTMTTSGFFVGIRIEIADGATPAATTVQNNTIRNISITSSTGNDVFQGIYTGGGTGIVNILGNTIGTVNGTGGAATGGITISSSNNAVVGHAIILTAPGSSNVQNNVVANFLVPTANNYFSGIFANSNIVANISNNTIGSLTEPKSIYFSDASTSTSINRYIHGMRLGTSGGSLTVTNNAVGGIWSENVYTGTTGQVVGIHISTTTANLSALTGNQIKNLYSAARSTGTAENSAIIGILASSTSANVANVSGNTIASLVSGGTSGAVNIIGLYATGATSVNNVFSNNNIHSVVGNAANNSAVIAGIYVAGGTSTYSNNMIRLGINPDGSNYTAAASVSGINSNTPAAGNFYNNTVYIGGVGVGTAATNTFAFKGTATSGTYNVKNNIFVNNRSNATTGGTHYAVYFTTSNAGAALNNNLYNTPGTGGMFAYNGSANVAAYAPGWISSDVLSVTGNPQFLVPDGDASTVNLHLNTAVASPAESHAAEIAAVTNDFDGDSRSGYSGSGSGSAPDIGADEFIGVYVNLNCTAMPTAGAATSSVSSAICPITSFTLGLNPAPSAQGLSFQWQSSDANANTWSNLGTAQASSFNTLTQTATTDYRCVVTCTGSGLSDTSTIITVVTDHTNCYCTPGTTNAGSNDRITNVTFAGINNTSGTSTGSNGYSNYTALTPASVYQSFTYPISVKVANGGTEYVSVWIDYNHNGVFDASEYKYLGSGNNVTISNTIQIPPAALSGLTRMRVRVRYNSEVGSGNPCGAYTYGETEDYMVNILAYTPCAGTPAPGNTIASVSSICDSGTSNLSVANSYMANSGISYQWQSSPDGTAWADLSGATTYTFTTGTLTQTTSFRLRMICASGPDTAYSNPATVTINPLPTVVVNPASDVFCSSVALTASGANTYAWSPATNLDATTGSTVNASPAASTTYTVSGTDANGCVNTATTTVMPMPSFTPSATVLDICAPNMPASIQVVPVAVSTGSVEYKLTDLTGNVLVDWQAGTTLSYTPTTEGQKSYYVFARNTACNTLISDTGNVSLYVGFDANIILTNASCANGDGSIFLSGTQGPGSGYVPFVWYSNDFSSTALDTSLAALRGVASITSGGLQLTPNSNNQKGGFIVKNPTAISGHLDSVTFILTVPQNGADGISWSFGDNVVYDNSIVNLEAGTGNKLILAFDSWGSPTDAIGSPGIYLTYGQNNNAGLSKNITSTMLAYSNNTTWRGASNKQISVYISSDNKLTLKLAGATIFNAVQLPAAYTNANKSDWQHLFAARTGGSSEQHLIDNLNIYYNSDVYVYGSAAANSGTMPAAWQSSPVFDSLTAGDSLDIWVANPTSPSTCNKFLGTYGVGGPMVTSNLGSGNPGCIGAQDGYVLLKVPASGTYSVSYNKDGGATVTQTGLTEVATGMGLAVAPSLTTGTYTNFKVTNAAGCVSNVIAGPITLTAPMPGIIAPSTTTSGAMVQTGAGTQYYTDPSCNLIAAITSPNNLGQVTSDVTVGAVVSTPSGEPFVGRYYEITPTQNAGMAMTLKLYFDPAEFAAYNASPLVLASSYPAIAADGSNLRIKAYHGLPASGTTGPGGMYNEANADLLQPTSVVLNASGFWEVTVNSPNGFSGFFANTNTSTPLAIKLGGISARNEGNVNIVEWNTKSETAEDYFVLERSNDGRSFKHLADIAANGKPGEYKYIDSKPFDGINYYRLILTNEDGTKEYSGVVNATYKNGAAFKFNVFPNPVMNELNVTVTQITGKGTIEISDITGRVLLSKDVTAATTHISMEGLADGIYLVKYHDDLHAETIKISKK